MDNMNEVVIIDYKMGNIGSVVNMIKKSGGVPIVSSDANTILAAKKLLLPGVGSFDAGMRSLKDSGLDKIICNAVSLNIPLLGICLGMQLLLSRSEEGISKGLNLVEGSVYKFISDDKYKKVPHMSWNTLDIKKNNKLLNCLDQDSRFYFVHSYYVKCVNNDEVLSTTKYINEFVSVFNKSNIYGAQFHPEKSHKYGMRLFQNYLTL
jgi:glutamine amidotransferase